MRAILRILEVEILDPQWRGFVFASVVLLLSVGGTYWVGVSLKLIYNLSAYHFYSCLCFNIFVIMTVSLNV